MRKYIRRMETEKQQVLKTVDFCNQNNYKKQSHQSKFLTVDGFYARK